MLARCAGGDKTFPLIAALFEKQDDWAFVRGQPGADAVRDRQAGRLHPGKLRQVPDRPEAARPDHGRAHARHRQVRRQRRRRPSSSTARSSHGAPTLAEFDKAIEPLLARAEASCGQDRLTPSSPCCCSPRFARRLRGRAPCCGDDALTPTRRAGDRRPAAGVSARRRTPSRAGARSIRSPTPTAKPPGGREVIANPTHRRGHAPGALPEMSLGRADAPVTIVEVRLADLPVLPASSSSRRSRSSRRQYIDTGKVRYILREFPIGKTVGRWRRSRCAARRPRSISTLYDKFMAQQAAWVSPGGAPRPDLQGRRTGGDDARSSLTPAARIKRMIDGAQLGQGARAQARHHRHAELLRPGQAREERCSTMKDIRAIVDPLLAGRAAPRRQPRRERPTAER